MSRQAELAQKDQLDRDAIEAVGAAVLELNDVMLAAMERGIRVEEKTTAFWLDDDDVMRGWYEDPDSADDERAEYVRLEQDGGGWPARESDAQECGTTLAALRDELTEAPSPAPMEGRSNGK